MCVACFSKTSFHCVPYRKTLLGVFALAKHHPTQLTFQRILNFTLQYSFEQSVWVIEKIIGERRKFLQIYNFPESLVYSIGFLREKFIAMNVYIEKIRVYLKLVPSKAS